MELTKTKEWLQVDLDVFEKASGNVPFSLTNDYLFRALMQEDEVARIDLIQSVVRFPKGVTITDTKVLNPIKLGESIKSKEYRLDILVSLNNQYNVNMEMQVANQADWPERSLIYLCRSFDKLNKGQMYGQAKTAIHIGLLNYDLFPEKPEFHSSWAVMNTRTNKVYSDKFQLYMVCLNQTKLATEEDRACHLDKWARLFRSKTWEEVKMIANGNPALTQAAATIHRMSEDEQIQYECLQRERALLFEASKRHFHQELEKKHEKLEADYQQLEADHQQLEADYSDAQKQLSQQADQIARQADQIRRLKEQMGLMDGSPEFHV